MRNIQLWSYNLGCRRTNNVLDVWLTRQF